LCTFNPIFGQGITTAAVGAKLLQKHLNEPENVNWEQEFHRQLIDLLASPWFYSVKEGIRDREGQQNVFKKKCWESLFKLYFRALPRDKHIHFALYEVQNLIKPVSSLFSIPLLVRAVWAIWFGKTLVKETISGPKSEPLHHTGTELYYP